MVYVRRKTIQLMELTEENIFAGKREAIWDEWRIFLEPPTCNRNDTGLGFGCFSRSRSNRTCKDGCVKIER